MQYDLLIKRTLRDAHGILSANLLPARNSHSPGVPLEKGNAALSLKRPNSIRDVRLHGIHSPAARVMLPQRATVEKVTRSENSIAFTVPYSRW
jgi:hypothetical protein